MTQIKRNRLSTGHEVRILSLSVEGVANLFEFQYKSNGIDNVPVESSKYIADSEKALPDQRDRTGPMSRR